MDKIEVVTEVKCWICGNPATETRAVDYNPIVKSFDVVPVSPYHRCYCKKCKEQVEEQERSDRELYIQLKKREMFIKACNMLEHQRTKMYEYKPAIDVVDDFIIEHPDKFDSSYEVLAAIVLVHNHIYSKMQYKIGRYQVDFLLPELLVVLEIDGERHRHKKTYDSARDIYIQGALGEGWDIIRIPTDYLDKDAKKLPEAIYKVIDYRQTGKVNWREL